MRLQLMEYAGVALIAVAFSFIHFAFSLGIVGLYLFVSAVLGQLTEGPKDGHEEDE